MAAKEIAIYILLILVLISSLPVPYLSYVGIIFFIIALLLSDQIRKQDKSKGNKLIIISVIVFVVSIIIGMFMWSLFFSSLMRFIV